MLSARALAGRRTYCVWNQSGRLQRTRKASPSSFCIRFVTSAFFKYIYSCFKITGGFVNTCMLQGWLKDLVWKSALKNLAVTDIQIWLFQRARLRFTRDYLKWNMYIIFIEEPWQATWKRDVQWIKTDPEGTLSSRPPFFPSVTPAVGQQLRELIYTDLTCGWGLAWR